MNEILDIMYEARRGDEVAYLYHIFKENPPFDITFIPEDEDDPNELSRTLEPMLCRFLRKFRAPGGLPEHVTASSRFVESVDEKEGITFKQIYKYDLELKPGRVY